MLTSIPRPLFTYGTLRALPLLVWALTGDASNISVVSGLVQPAKVYGYVRFSLHHRDYPAVIRHEAESSVDGYLLTLETACQRKRIVDFEGEAYKPVSVVVKVIDPHGKSQGAAVEADMYLWDGDADVVTTSPWELGVFERERLEDWLDLFDGVELVGGNEEEASG